jgi:hypothetical protein
MAKRPQERRFVKPVAQRQCESSGFRRAYSAITSKCETDFLPRYQTVAVDVGALDLLAAQ